MRSVWFDKARKVLLLSFIVFCVGTAKAQLPFQDANLPTDSRVEDLVSRMTLQEKIMQMGHKSSAISRLGVSSYNYWNEALHGVARAGLATSFPQAIALASTWNPELMFEVATATSDEARVKNNTDGKGLTYWCPTINMARDPRWGRSEENYGEDIYLTSRMAVSFIRGMQGNNPRYLKTVATAKHFACNNIEKNRYSISSDVDERSLREYYLPAFEACVKEGKVFSVMSAYNAVNGVPSPANRTLLTNILRNEWGFNGYVVSDCDAAGNVWDSHKYVATAPEATAISVRNGNDLNCGTTFPDNAMSAISKGLMSEEDLNLALKRVFKARFLLGEFDPIASVPYRSIPASRLDCQENRDLALRAAREAIVLLKNANSFLPLNKDSIQTIAIIGPNAKAVQLGGYSGTPSVSVSALQGIATKFGVDISMGTIEAENYSNQSGIRTETCTEGGSNVGYIQNGDYVEYDSIDFSSGKEKLDLRIASMTTVGYVEIVLDNINGTSLGKFSIPVTGGWQTWSTLTFNIPKTTGVHKVWLKFSGGSGYLFNLNWFRFYNITDIDPTSGDGKICYAQGCTVTGSINQTDFDKAVSFAKKSDVAIFVCGTDLSVADESNDRTSLNLPGVQEQLLKAVYRANPKTVLVMVTGASLAVNWAQDSLPAILSAWYNGQSQGTAIADVLFGDYNPRGKLTTTWYKSTSDLPAMNDYNIKNNRTYMYFPGKPLYPFGYGLSYTSFEYSNLKISSNDLNSGDSTIISADIKNTGEVTGDEVAQLYVHIGSAKLLRPIKELKGFQSVHLEPGETKTVNFVLKHNELSYYDEVQKAYMVENEKVDILVGSSSQDIRLNGEIFTTEGTVSLAYRQNPFVRMEAEHFENKSKTVKIVNCTDGGQCVDSLSNNSYIVFKNLDFSTAVRQFQASISSIINNASMQIVLDRLDGKLIGTLPIASTGNISTYSTQLCDISETTGVHDVYLIFRTNVNNGLKLNWFNFKDSVSGTTDVVKANINPFEVIIYPNPSRKNVTVKYQLASESKVNIEIYNMKGTLVKSVDKGVQSNGEYSEVIQTSRSGFKSGLYFLKFMACNKEQSFSLEILD